MPSGGSPAQVVRYNVVALNVADSAEDGGSAGGRKITFDDTTQRFIRPFRCRLRWQAVRSRHVMVDSLQTPNAVPVPEGSRPKLLDQVRHTIRMRHYSRRTEATYVHWIRRFIVFHHKTHPSTLGAPEITAFLSWLATGQRASSSTQNQALSAVLFLYRHVLHIEVGAIEQVPRAKMPHRVPVVLSREEVGTIFKNLKGTMWMVVALLYGAGLRLQECLELRVKDLDFDRHDIVVRRGKGQKDRRTCYLWRSRSGSRDTCGR